MRFVFSPSPCVLHLTFFGGLPRAEVCHMDEKQYVVDAISIDESWRVFRIMAEFVEALRDSIVRSVV